jgi:hypothetical protein
MGVTNYTRGEGPGNFYCTPRVNPCLHSCDKGYAEAFILSITEEPGRI